MKTKLTLIVVMFFLFFYISSAGWEQIIHNYEAYNLNDACILSADTAIVVGDSGVVRYTSDAGGIWNGLFVQGNTNLRSITCPERNNAIAVGDDGNIYVSKNQGKSWVRSVGPGLGFNDNLLDISFFDSQNGVIVGNRGIILKTTDGGSNWTSITNSIKVQLRNVAWVNSTTIVAVGDSGTILRSTDCGTNWASVESGCEANLELVRVPSPGRIYVIGDSLIVLQSKDLGQSWNCRRLLNVFPEVSNPEIGGAVFLDSLYGVIRITSHSTKSSLYELYTDNGGVNWRLRDIGTNNYYAGLGIKTMEYYKNEFGICVGLNGEIAYIRLKDDAFVYYFSSYNLTKLCNNIATTGSSNVLCIFSSRNTILSEDKGKTWTVMPKWDTIGSWRGSMVFESVSYTDPNTIFYGMNNRKDSSYDTGTTHHIIYSYTGYILKSTDKGITWKEIIFPKKIGLYSIIMLDSREGVALLDQQYFYGTHDGWETYDSCYLPDTTIDYVSSINYPEEDYLFLSAFRKDKTPVFYSTSDNGATWDSSFTLPNYCQSVTFITKDKAVAWGQYSDSSNAVYYDVVKLTNDRGLTWDTKVYEPSDGTNKIVKAVLGRNKMICYKSSYYPSKSCSYFITTDNGNTWKKDSIPSALFSEPPRDMAVLNDEVIFVGGSRGTLLMNSDERVSVEPAEEDLRYSGIVIVPNPADDNIAVYTKGQNPGQKITLYNSLGEELPAKVSIEESSDTSSYKLDISSLPAGVYFVKAGNLIGKFVKK